MKTATVETQIRFDSSKETKRANQFDSYAFPKAVQGPLSMSGFNLKEVVGTHRQARQIA